MKLAILLLCHKNAEQINLFLQTMKHPDIDFYIHVDKKSHITSQIEKRPDIHILPDSLRVDVQWSGISMIQATLNMLQEAYCSKKFDYYWLCSGQDFPLKSPKEIVLYFQNYWDKNFVSLISSANYLDHKKNSYDKRNDLFFPRFLMRRNAKARLLKRIFIEVSGGWNHTFPIFERRGRFAQTDFYYGPQWWAITNAFAGWLLKYLKDNPWYMKGYCNSLTPDESFFQTLLMMSPYKDTQHEYLHYIDWSERPGKPRNSPNTLTLADYDKMKASGYLMARKFDMDVDKDIIYKLMKDNWQTIS